MNEKTTTTKRQFFYPMISEKNIIVLNEKYKIKLLFYLLSEEETPLSDENINEFYTTYVMAKEMAIKNNISPNRIRIAYALHNKKNLTPRGAEEIYYKFEDAIAFLEK